MNDATVSAVFMTFDALILITRLRDLVGRIIPLTDPTDLITLGAVQRWLHINLQRDGLARFLFVVDRAINLIERNLAIKSAGISRKQNQFPCRSGARALSVIGDSRGLIFCCGESFFCAGPECQRNVITHERFHLAGIAHGLNPDGSPRLIEPVATSTPEEALNNADDMMDLVKDIKRQAILACPPSANL